MEDLTSKSNRKFGLRPSVKRKLRIARQFPPTKVRKRDLLTGEDLDEFRAAERQRNAERGKNISARVSELTPQELVKRRASDKAKKKRQRDAKKAAKKAEKEAEKAAKAGKEAEKSAKAGSGRKSDRAITEENTGILYMLTSRLGSNLLFCIASRAVCVTMADASALKRAGIDKDPKDVTDAEWKKVLTPEQYHVTRQAGTERPFSGEFNKHKLVGRYFCVSCGVELFESNSKFDSGCGWPAFSESVGKDANIVRNEDVSHGMKRVEVRCNKCNAHLGHVFEDGPKPSGERYCINSVAIDFASAKKDEL